MMPFYVLAAQINGKLKKMQSHLDFLNSNFAQERYEEFCNDFIRLISDFNFDIDDLWYEDYLYRFSDMCKEKHNETLYDLILMLDDYLNEPYRILYYRLYSEIEMLFEQYFKRIKGKNGKHHFKQDKWIDEQHEMFINFFENKKNMTS